MKNISENNWLDAPKKRRSQINLDQQLIPLLNIMLLLLIFFMTSNPLSPWRFLEISLPKTSAQNSSNNSPITLTLDAAGEIWIEKDKVAFEDITAILQVLWSHRPKSILQIQADKNAKAERLSALLVLLQALGKKDIQLLIEQK
jgi:biopolymer transport protein ExbD